MTPNPKRAKSRVLWAPVEIATGRILIHCAERTQRASYASWEWHYGNDDSHVRFARIRITEVEPQSLRGRGGK